MVLEILRGAHLQRWCCHKQIDGNSMIPKCSVPPAIPDTRAPSRWSDFLSMHHESLSTAGQDPLCWHSWAWDRKANLVVCEHSLCPLESNSMDIKPLVWLETEKMHASEKGGDCWPLGETHNSSVVKKNWSYSLSRLSSPFCIQSTGWWLLLIPVFREGFGERRGFNLMTDLYKIFTYTNI